MQSLLFTGASGFVGRNTVPELRQHYHVTTLGRTLGCDVVCDLAADVPVLPGRFDVVVHAAGLAHLQPHNAAEVRLFFEVNVTGTRNLCTALERVGAPRALIFVSSVAVYGGNPGRDITEDHPLDGTSAYALSKIEAEEVLTTWCAAHNVALTILRPSLIAGPGAPGNLGAMVHGIRKGRYADIAGGTTECSILNVKDMAPLIRASANGPAKPGHPLVLNVCTPRSYTFRELSTAIAAAMGKRAPMSIPRPVAQVMALTGDALAAILPARYARRIPITGRRLRRITATLTFSPERAMHTLHWTPQEVDIKVVSY